MRNGADKGEVGLEAKLPDEGALRVEPIGLESLEHIEPIGLEPLQSVEPIELESADGVESLRLRPFERLRQGEGGEPRELPRQEHPALLGDR